uniref:Heat shock protein 90 n=1 Tax=Kalanchoe fedtschenkoi TaxID=63787 RepID=A0A7N0V194_KALFE
MKGRRVFEINPGHPIIQNLNAACRANPNNEEALRAIDLLYDAALVTSGFTPENPAQLGGKMYEMMNSALAGKWSVPAAEIQHEQPLAAESTPEQQPTNPETYEAEVVEPVAAGSKKQ